MFTLLPKRRKNLLWGAAIGATSAAAAYCWWAYWGKDAVVSAGRAKSDAELIDLVRASTPATGDKPHCPREVKFQQGQQQQQKEVQEVLDAAAEYEELEQSLDASMDSHFSYIQQVSAPQELEQLLPRLQAVLYQMTDIAQLRQSPSPSPSGSALADASSSPQPSPPQPQQPAAVRLKALARLSFSRTLGACWLIPLMDLYVRVKLNVIGRHLFLQEKLHQMNPVAAATGYGPQGTPLPPRLSPAAIEAFLRCDYFADTGCRYVIQKVMEGVDAVLSGTSVEAEVSPQQLLGAMASMLSAGDLSMRGDSGVEPIQWGEVLAGPLELASHAIDVQHAAAGGADSYRRAIANASMVEELHVELNSMLTSYRFAEAVRAAVQHAFRAVASQVYASIPDGDAAGGARSPFANSAGASSSGPGSSEASGSGNTEGAAGMRRGKSSEWASAVPSGLASTPKPPRPMARMLKAVQSSAEPVFGNIRGITRDIAGLPEVMGLCATVFACSAPGVWSPGVMGAWGPAQQQGNAAAAVGSA